MTAAFNFSQALRSIRKQWLEDASLYLLIVLLGLLTMFFAFWTPAGSPGYRKETLKDNEVITINKVEKSDPAFMYKTIVTNGGAIRFVLQ